MKYISKNRNPVASEQIQNNSVNQPPCKPFVIASRRHWGNSKEGTAHIHSKNSGLKKYRYRVAMSVN